MISSKILVLTLLLSAPFSFTQVQLSSIIEIEDSHHHYYDVMDSEIRIDVHKPIVIWEGDMVIKINLVDEQGDIAIVEYEIYVENNQWNYELLTAPTLRAEYNKKATARFEQSNGDGQTKSLKISMIATKVE